MKRLALALALLATVLAASLVTRQVVVSGRHPVVVVQWANSHPMREGLLPAMAKKFNEEDHKTENGDPIEVIVLSCDSATQVDDLVARVKGGATERSCKDPLGGRAPDPTIVTPQSADWLTDINSRVGADVVDVHGSPHIAETWLGIVTYRDMAACLGWPTSELAYQDIVDLRADPLGWERQGSCARQEWGRSPLLDFTNPETSTSGRNVLVSLYSMFAGKPPASLTLADVDSPEVTTKVQGFQQLVDHYMPGTIAMNTKIAQGPSAGHFFLMPEDNLVSLYQGNEKAIGPDGAEHPVDAIQDLVMIYPKEGSVLNGHPAAVVDAPWVTAEQADASGDWIEFLRGDSQQRTFTEHGFRPASGTNVEVDATQFSQWGLQPEAPTNVIEPGDLAPDVLTRMMDSWGSVKKPAVVTFVVDVSGSMKGQRLDNVKAGLDRVIDAMSAAGAVGRDSQVGVVAFSDSDNTRTLVAPAPLGSARYDIADKVAGLEARGQTALYEAVAVATRLTDDADAEPGATRAVVVLSDGDANDGRMLDTVVSLSSDAEKDIVPLKRYPLDTAEYVDGQHADPADIRGDALLVPHSNKVQVFFVGFGEADIDVGRILAEATGAEYLGSTEQDLASVIEELSGYF